MSDKALVKIILAFTFAVAFLFGMLTGSKIEGHAAYRQGQIDYQKGKIEYIVESDRILKVEKSK